MRRLGRERRKGSALLAVLWLSMALTAIAFTLSRTVRSELDRASLNVDSARAQFLARGGIERAMLRLLRLQGEEGDPALGFRRGQRWMRLAFPEGEVVVEIVSENGKLNVNKAPPEALERVLAAAGLDPSLSAATASRIVAARAPSGQQLLNPADTTDGSSLLRRPASFNQLEELLVLPGLTTDVLYGAYRRGPAGEWVKTGGLHRHLSIYGGTSIDANYASPEVLRAAGLPPGQIDSLLELRELRPLRPEDLGQNLMLGQSGAIRVTAGGGGIAYTLWSRATLYNGRARRAVGALVERSETIGAPPIRIARWYDSEF